MVFVCTLLTVRCLEYIHHFVFDIRHVTSYRLVSKRYSKWDCTCCTIGCTFTIQPYSLIFFIFFLSFHWKYLDDKIYNQNKEAALVFHVFRRFWRKKISSGKIFTSLDLMFEYSHWLILKKENVYRAKWMYTVVTERTKIFCFASSVGFEPTTSGLEVRRAIPCATRTYLSCC